MTHMNDIRFDCPSCRTALIVADIGEGRAIACPKCTTSIQVPGAIRVQLADNPPPISPMHKQDYRDHDWGVTMRTRNCTIAYVSFALVCLSLLTGGLLMLPGIICGHIALEQCRRDPSLLGRSYAVAALSVGYSLIALVALLVLGFFALITASSGS